MPKTKQLIESVEIDAYQVSRIADHLYDADSPDYEEHDDGPGYSQEEMDEVRANVVMLADCYEGLRNPALSEFGETDAPERWIREHGYTHVLIADGDDLIEYLSKKPYPPGAEVGCFPIDLVTVSYEEEEGHPVNSPRELQEFYNRRILPR